MGRQAQGESRRELTGRLYSVARWLRRTDSPLYSLRLMLKALRFFTLLIAALSLTMESAHVLELPQKMKYDMQTYTAVNGTLYKWFAIVGGSYQIVSVLLAIALAFALRGRGTAFAWTAGGAAGLVVAFVIWLPVVEPVNIQVAHALAADPQSGPTVWTQLRERWEYAHAAGFVAQIAGFSALIISLPVNDRGSEV